MKKKLYIKIFILFFYSLNLLSVDIPFFYKGARPIALGDAFTAVADDENVISYNPAGLIDITENKISIAVRLFSYDFLNENYTNNCVSFALLRAGSFGIQVFYNLLGDKISLKPGKTFLYEGLKITASFAHSIINNIFYIGLNGNVIVQTGKAGGSEFDLGFIYKINKYLKTGISIKNIINLGNFLILDDLGNVRIISYPAFLNIGVSVQPLEFFLVSFEIKNILETKSIFVDLTTDENKYFYFKRSYHLGGEFNFLKDFFIMTGVEAKEDVFNFDESDIYKMRYGISLGLGYVFQFLRINITFVNDFREVFNVKNPWQICFSITGDY